MFQRFRRLNVDTPGSGLGLAIVRHVARSHGGDAHFTPGVGRVVGAALPAVAADACTRLSDRPQLLLAASPVRRP